MKIIGSEPCGNSTLSSNTHTREQTQHWYPQKFCKRTYVVEKYVLHRKKGFLHPKL